MAVLVDGAVCGQELLRLPGRLEPPAVRVLREA